MKQQNLNSRLGPGVLALIAFFSASLYGQVAISGKIAGFVADPSGAGIAGATVNVSSGALMAPRVAKTQNDGSFLFDQLPVGTYEVKVEMPGFKTLLQPDIVLTAGFTATLNIKLEVGDLSQSVTITAEEPVIDVKSVENTTAFGTSLLQNIPSGRDPWSTVAQIPGASLSTFDVGGSQMYQQSTMEIHGSKPGEQVYSYNGLKLNWPGGNGGSTAFYSDHDAQEEFQVVTDAAPAEVSVGGLYMNQITKSGSNEWHGLAAMYYQTSAFQAQTQLPIFKGVPVNAGLPFAMGRDVTADAGGPIIKDRWWIFGAWRNYDIRQNVLAVRTQAGTPTFDDNHQSNATFRNDVQLTPKQRISIIWLWNEQNRFYRRGTTYSYTASDAAQRQIEPAYVLQGQWTYSPTANLNIEARFGYMKLHFPLDYEPGVGSALSIADTSLSTLSGAAQSATLDITGTTRAATNMSYFKGNFHGTHNIKAGYDFDYSSKQDFTNINGNINVYYNNGLPFEIYVYDTPLAAKSSFREGAAFVQDTWTLSRRITVTVGVRYENFVTWLPAQQSPAAGFPTLFPTRTYTRTPNSVDWNTFVPRTGISWDPKGDSKQVVHAGYNRFTLSEGTRLAEAINPNASSYQIYKWNGAMTAAGVPDPSEFETTANFLGSVGGIVTTVDPNLKRPYDDEVNVGYERQILGDLRISATYYYRRTKQQISRINAAIPTSAYSPITVTDPLNGQPMTIYSLASAYVGKAAYVLTNVDALNDNNYNGVEFSALKRLSHHWQVLTGFTIQRDRGLYGNALSDNFNDPNLGINRANALLDQDSTYVAKIAGTYEGPWGITFSPNYQYYTGYPLLPTNVFTGLPQGSETISLLPRGAIRLPNISVLNLRISKHIKFREGKIGLEPIADLLNLTNSEPITAETTSYGANYLKPTNLVNPFIARFALRLTF